METTSLSAYGGPTFFHGDALMSDMIFLLQLAGRAPTDFAQVFPSMVCRVADQGVRAIVQVVDSAGAPVNLHGASKKLIKLMRPSGATYDAAALFLTNGFDGRIYFASSATVPPFDQAGVWFLQAEVTVDSVQQSTKWGSFAVQPNIDAN
jgi:hypothetical protein